MIDALSQKEELANIIHHQTNQRDNIKQGLQHTHSSGTNNHHPYKGERQGDSRSNWLGAHKRQAHLCTFIWKPSERVMKQCHNNKWVEHATYTTH